MKIEVLIQQYVLNCVNVVKGLKALEKHLAWYW